MAKIKKKIGLLGGIGPEATGEFYLALISKFQERGFIKSNKDFPQIVINSIPAPELIHEEISEKDLKTYVRGLKELEKFGVDFISMICNTIYLFYEKLQKEIRIPIIDLRKEVRNYLIDNKIKSVAVLGSSNVVKKGLYRFKNIEYIEPKRSEIKMLSEAIFNFNKGFNKMEQGKIVKDIAKNCLKRGADFILLGCTEVVLMLKNENIPKINTMEILEESTIKYAIS